MRWYIIVSILCAYGFVKQFRPSEPFLNAYLTSSYKNFTNDDLSEYVYPVSTYSCFLFMIFIFFFSDPLRYKFLILFESLSYASCWALLCWGDTIPLMQLMQFFYGCARASEVAFYSYMYVVIENDQYQKVTSWVRSSVLVGDFLSYGISQLLVSVFAVSYLTLNYISLTTMCMIIGIALFLPWTSWREDKSLKVLEDQNLPTSYFEYVKFYFRHLWKNFKTIYSTTFMWKWTLWWALASCGFYQIGNYAQNLWSYMQPDQSNVYNGLVECINTFLSALVVFLMQFIHLRWEIWGEITLSVTAAIDCAVLLVMSQTDNIVLSYCCYSLTRILYQFMISIAMYNIAKRLKTENYGLVFGFNTFIALLLQAILTFVVVGKNGLHLFIRTQFEVYGVYYGFIAVVFFFMGIHTLYKTFSPSVQAYKMKTVTSSLE